VKAAPFRSLRLTPIRSARAYKNSYENTPETHHRRIDPQDGLRPTFHDKHMTTLVYNTISIAKTLPRDILGTLGWIPIGVVCLLSWKLNKEDTYMARIVRILVTLVLISTAWKAMHTGNEMGTGDESCIVLDHDSYTMNGLKALACILPLAFIWVSAFAAFFGNLLAGTLDPKDSRRANLNVNIKLDRLAKLANSGHKSAAISLARQMKKSGNYSALAMDTMIARLQPPKDSKESCTNSVWRRTLASDTKRHLKNL